MKETICLKCKLVKGCPLRESGVIRCPKFEKEKKEKENAKETTL